MRARAATIAFLTGWTCACALGGPDGLLRTRLADPPSGRTVMVIVAGRDLYPGVEIAEEDLYAVQIPPEHLPEHVFLSPEHVVGRKPAFRILANEFVRAELLADPEHGSSTTDVLPAGLRLVDVPGADLPIPAGSYVDVSWRPPGGEPCLLLQAVFVATKDGRIDLEPGAARRLGLLVTPEQAFDLAVAARDPSFRLTARNELDVSFDGGRACTR